MPWIRRQNIQCDGTEISTSSILFILVPTMNTTSDSEVRWRSKINLPQFVGVEERQLGLNYVTQLFIFCRKQGLGNVIQSES